MYSLIITKNISEFGQLWGVLIFRFELENFTWQNSSTFKSLPWSRSESDNFDDRLTTVCLTILITLSSRHKWPVTEFKLLSSSDSFSVSVSIALELGCPSENRLKSPPNSLPWLRSKWKSFRILITESNSSNRRL